MLLFGTFSLLALVAIWGGYPLVVRALAGLRRERRVDSAGPERTVSVIIASHDDAAAITARVQDVLAGEYPPHLIEVVVALDAARAKTTPEALQHLDSRVRVLRGDAPGGKAPALNAAVRAARHELLVFTDTAQKFEPDAIGEIVAQFGDERVGAASGMLELAGKKGSRNLAERYWRYERWLRHWEAQLHSTVGVTGAIYGMRRSLWGDLPAGLINDDVYVPMRLVLQGWRVAFTERARAFDARRFAAAEEYRRKVRTLTGVIQICAWLPGVMNPVRNPIWLQFVFHKLLRLLTPYLTVFVAVAALVLVVGAVVASPVGMQLLPVALIAAATLCLVPRIRRML